MSTNIYRAPATCRAPEGTQPFPSGTSSAGEADGKAGVLPRHQQQKERKPRSKVLL